MRIDGKGLIESLEKKAARVRGETLKIHARAPETRIASSLSAVEIFTVLYYGGLMRFDPKETGWAGRDRLIVSKGHGAISLYPILADTGYFDAKELERVCREGSFLGGIPDPVIPGFETINGSLGHGLGVACGMALALKRKKREEKVFVLLGDGEMYEGAVWEAFMFAGEHCLDNLIAIIDNNRACMLDFCRNILDLEPFDEKIRAFKWDVSTVDGHDVAELYDSLLRFKEGGGSTRPKALVANTVKGKGVARLEADPLSHIKNLTAEEVANLLEGLG